MRTHAHRSAEAAKGTVVFGGNGTGAGRQAMYASTTLGVIQIKLIRNLIIKF